MANKTNKAEIKSNSSKEPIMPLWKWFALFILAITLSKIGYSPLINYVTFPPLYLIGGAALLALYALGVRIIEKKPAKDVKLNRLLPDLSMGFVLGGVFFLIVIGVMVIFNICYFVPSTFTRKALLNIFLFHFAIAVGEEMIFRGVIFRWIDERWNTTIALIVSSLLFGLMHLSNSAVTIWIALALTIEAGLLFGAAYKYSGSLWFPIGIHWAWNFVHANIFGFSAYKRNTIFHPIIKGTDFITGGSFGIEASIITVIIGLAFSIGLLHRSTLKNSNLKE